MKAVSEKPMQNNQLVARTFRSYMGMTILITLSATLGMMIDNVIAGNFLGAYAVAAIGMASPLLMMFSGCAGIIETGAVALAARALGRRDTPQVNALFSVALCLGLGIGLLCVVLAHGGAGFIASLMGATDGDLHQNTKDFVSGLGLGALSIVLLQLNMGFVRLDGAPSLGLAAIICMSVSDVCFNLIAILVFDAGLFGMGLATSLAYTLGLLVCCTHYASKKCTLRLVNPFAQRGQVFDLLKTGVPDSLTRLCVMARTFVFNHLLLIVATASAVAALSMLSSVNAFLSSVTIGVGQTATLLCGIFYGERDTLALRSTLRVALKYGLVLCVALSLVVFIFAPQVVGLFGLTEGDAQAQGIIAVRLYCLCVPICLVNSLFINYYQGVGNLKAANFVTIGESFLFSAAFALCTVWFLGSWGVWVAFLVGEAATLVMQVVVAVVLWRRNHQVDLSTRNTQQADLLEKLMYLPDDFQIDICASLSTTCPVTPEGPVECSTRVEQWCKSHQVDNRRCYLVALGIEEMTSNIIRYGFTKTKSPALDVRLILKSDDSLVVRLRDNGAPFNPMDYDLSSAGTESCIGIKMIRATMKGMEYHTAVGLNNVVVELSTEKV